MKGNRKSSTFPQYRTNILVLEVGSQKRNVHQPPMRLEPCHPREGKVNRPFPVTGEKEALPRKEEAEGGQGTKTQPTVTKGKGVKGDTPTPFSSETGTD